MKDNKKIPTKNYIIVFVVFAICIAVVFGVRAWYRNYMEYNLTIPVLSGKISELKLDEFDEYVTAHDDFYLYIGTASNSNCRSIENKLVDELEKRNIKDETIYLNMSEEKNSNELYNKLSKMGTINKNFKYPVFAIIKDGKILGIVAKSKSTVRIGDIEKLLDEYEVGVE